MIAAPFPDNENARMQALHRYKVLDTAEEQAYDELVNLAAGICGTPTSVITLIDGSRQWFKAKAGIEGKENSRHASFCGHTILSNDLMEVPNALEDERFYDNPAVLGGLKIRFYAGAPLHIDDGYNLGTLCVFDSTTRFLSEDQKSALKVLAKQVVKQLELDLKERQLQARKKELNGIFAISEIKERRALSMEEMLQEIVNVIPQAFQFPRYTFARIRLGKYTAQTNSFTETSCRLFSPIGDGDGINNALEVFVSGGGEEASRIFLPEEENLIKVMARQINTVAERQAYEDKFRRLNQELELKVNERTADLKYSNDNLQIANKELESFSYSVSHDLRAPLRAIIGYSKILNDDFASLLGEEGVGILNHIIKNTTNMGQLIDDLLEFSRLGRQEKVVQDFSMAQLVKEIVNELKEENTGREIVFNIEDLPNAIGDHSLLRQVVKNVLSNAVKFTEKKKQAIITVSSFTKEGKVVYKFEDNGAGFKMQYAGKIFEVFQRLHSTADFSGTGIGMALAQKIIHRHGGSIWAEGKVDKGAIFYFSTI